MLIRYQNFNTTQDSTHHNLEKIVLLHAKTNFLRPIPQHQIDAFAKIKRFVQDFDRSIIIDSGCGTGLSTQNLAKLFPDHIVIGIDKSIARLSRAHRSTSNVLLIRGDVIDLWRLFLQEKLPIMRHYLFYPNPWPKISHVKRRFHAHPIFKTMISLAPYFELRTNWRIYADECAFALKVLGHNPTRYVKTDKTYISLFEKKYVEENCPIYVVINS